MVLIRTFLSLPLQVEGRSHARHTATGEEEPFEGKP